MVFVFILPVSDLNVWFSLIWANLLNIIYNMSAMYAFLQGQFNDSLAFHSPTKQSSVSKLTTDNCPAAKYIKYNFY